MRQPDTQERILVRTTSIFMSHFSLISADFSVNNNGNARAGVLKTQHGEISTPFFMPVATRGAIKAGVCFDDLEHIGAQICLANTYHLHLRPGEKKIAEMGGLHKWMGWNKPILTDSGGFQVFSIQRKKITDDGVWFNSHIDGKRIFLDAETSIQIQHHLGADIIMAFDECPPSQLQITNDELQMKDEKTFREKMQRKLFFKVQKAVERTTAWAKRSLDYHNKLITERQAVPVLFHRLIFGIVQGGCFPELRERSIREITAMNFDGFAFGGLAVGEPPEAMYKVLDEFAEKLPSQKPRYLMGVGTPTDLLEAVARGMDMFDCVLPARNARHGTIFTNAGILKITNATFANDKKVLDESCDCAVCREKKISRAYLHYLIRVDEDLGRRYLTIHNLYFYQDLMQKAHEHILAGNFLKWKEKMVGEWGR